jgi:signal transduction histidine kinase
MIWFRAASVALLLFELVLLAIRFPLTPSKLELLCFSGLLILVIAAGFLPDSTVAVGVSSLAILWNLGTYARYLSAERRAWFWHGGAGVVLSIFLFVRLIGLAQTLPFYLLYAFLFIVLSLYPLILLSGICRENTHPLLYLYLTAVAVQLAALLYDYLSYGTVIPVLRLRVFSGLLYAAICGLLLSQEAYLQGSGWQGLHIRLGEQQRRLREAYSRLIQTENTVMLQDRLIVTGILTAGAAHEFKNTLSLIQTSAAFAARTEDGGSARQALDLIFEQARAGQKAVTELLDQLLKRGREEADTVNLRSDLDSLLRMIRTGCRREGIHMIIDIPDSMGVTVRRGELEQVLVNLVRNAMDSVGSQAGGSERKVMIRARPAEGQGVIEVIDSGAGVPPELQNRIFELSVSGTQSTGLGLFLAKALVERNRGTLAYIPTDRGACFRVILPRQGKE